MLTRPVLNLLLTSMLGFLITSVGSGMNNSGWPEQSGEQQFNLTRLPENPTQYSLVISDGDERNISGNFSVDQLQILRAIMDGAEKLALSDEATGTKEPVTTRFMDKQEKAFIVDVEKLGIQSKLYLTIKTEIGHMTVEAGRISRNTRREEGFYFDLLSRLDAVLPKLPAKPPK